MSLAAPSRLAVPRGQILSILQQNARTPNAEIARQVGMAPSAVLERIRKLEARGVIRGYEARIDPEALGLNLLAFVFVRAADIGGSQTGEVPARIPEVQEVHHIAGEDCESAQIPVDMAPGVPVAEAVEKEEEVLL